VAQITFTSQTVFKALIMVAVLWGLLNAKTILFPLIVAVVLSFILNPWVEYLGRCRLYPLKTPIPRTIAVILTFVVAAGVLTLLLAFVLLPFAHEFEKFVVNLPEYMSQAGNLIYQLQQKVSRAEVPDTVRSLIDEGMANAAGYSVVMGRRFLAGTIGIASRIIDLVVVPVLTFYFLKDWMQIRETFIDLVPLDRRPKVRQIINDIGLVISGYIRGQVTVSAIMGLLVFAGMYFFDVNYALTIGLIAALTEFVPIIGPILGSIPALLISILASPALAAKVAIFYVGIHQLENHIIVPKVMGSSIDLHPVTVIIAFLVGAQLFGLAGMILAVPVAAIMKVVFYHIWVTT